MRIEIVNWGKYNPRNDYKSIPWFRFNAGFPFDYKMSKYDAEQKYLFVFLLCFAAKENCRYFDIDSQYIALLTNIKEGKIKKTLDQLKKDNVIKVKNKAHVRETIVTRTADDRETFATKRNERTNVTNYNVVAKKLLDFLNKVSERRLKPVDVNLDPIINRLKDGYNDKQIGLVFAYKSQADEFFLQNKQYLTPQTLCRKGKFPNYLEEAEAYERNSGRS